MCLSFFSGKIGVTGVMIARGAQSNVSVFRKEGPVAHLDIVKEYIQKVRIHHNGKSSFCT